MWVCLLVYVLICVHMLARVYVFMNIHISLYVCIYRFTCAYEYMERLINCLISRIFLIKMILQKYSGTEEMAQQLRVLPALVKDQSLVLNIYIGKLTTSCISRGSKAFFWSLITAHKLITKSKNKFKNC